MGEIANNQAKIENEAYNDFLETQLKSEQEAMNILESYVKNGVPPTQPMLDAAGYSNYTPESFMQAYINNKASIAKANKAGSGGDTPKVTDKDKLSYSAKQGIYDYITGENYTPEGLRARLSSYDWDKYDAEDAKEWLVSNFATDNEVFNVVNSFFGVDSADNAEETETESDTEPKGVDVKKYAQKIADDINRVYSVNQSEEGLFAPIHGGNGTYKVDNIAINRVIQTVTNDTALTDDEKTEILHMFGITDQQLIDFYNNNNY
jgi:hypothetical protein